MKNLLLILSILLNFSVLNAQKKGDAKTAKETAPSSSPNKNNNDVPEKWKNESAVILDQTLTFAYYNSTSFLSGDVNNVVKETVAKRVKLLDKSAVSDFSEFYFYESQRDERVRERNEKKGSSDEGGIKITVVKPSGERVKVNISDAIEVKDDVPNFYRSYFVGNKKYKKIAIPNLNVGDVFEYQFSLDYDVDISGTRTFHAFPEFYNTLSTKYAVVKQEFNFMLESGFCINMNTYNGAPAFKRLDYGFDFKGKKTDKMRTFQIVDADREKLAKEMMSQPRTEYPSVKMQVVAKLRSMESTEGSIFIGEKDAVKRTVEPNEVADRFNSDYRNNYDMISLGSYSRWMRKNKIDAKPVEEQAKLIYGYVKYRYLLLVAAPQIMSAESKTVIYKYVKASNSIKDFYFAVFMSKCLEDLNIKHEVVAAMPRNAGKIKDLLLGSEITWVVKVENAAGKALYFYPMDGYQTSDVNRETYLFGGEGYAFIPSQKRNAKDNIVARKVVIPIPDPSVNTFKTTATASFDDQFEKLNVDRIVSATGSLKSNYSPYTTLGYEFLEEYEKYYDSDYDEEKAAKAKKKAEEKKKKKKTKEDIKDEEDMKLLLDKRKELLQNELKDDYDDIDAYDSFELVNPGILENSPVLTFKEKFKLKNLINKAGRNYTIEIGKILSKQPKIDEDDLKPRQSEIQMNAPKIIEYEVELTLPAGYTIEDLKELNSNLDNDMMSFKVESKLVGDKLTVKTTKVYKKITAPKTEWQKIVDGFTAAYNFSQKKIVLKKK